tara:strand:+ start:1410 stop:1736 length:327 start_codon:yes stop_codon:yes gene_type:complete
MAYSYTWEINESNMISDVSDGFIKTIVFRVKGMDGNTEKARRTGEIELTKPESLPSDFVAFNSVTKAKSLEWVKAALGATEVTAIENALKAQIDLINTPTEKVGAPWS